jgi:hypothetical protein
MEGVMGVVLSHKPTKGTFQDTLHGLAIPS